MPLVKISSLVELTAPAPGDMLVIVDISEPADLDKTKRISKAVLVGDSIPKSVVTAAGDILVATGNAAVGKLAKSTDGQVLTMVTGAPAWATSKGLHAIGMVSASPNQDTTSTSLVDVTGATVTLALTVPCTIILLALVQGYVAQSAEGFIFKVYGMIDGTSDAGVTSGNGSATTQRNEALPYMYMKTGVPVGNRIVKLQVKDVTGGTHNHVETARIIALAFAE